MNENLFFFLWGLALASVLACMNWDGQKIGNAMQVVKAVLLMAAVVCVVVGGMWLFGDSFAALLLMLFGVFLLLCFIEAVKGA